MKWGLLSYGTIAPKFLASLHSLAGEELVAIATRSNAEKARQDYPDIKVYEDYSDLYTDSDIDIIYLSSTHNFHFEQGIEVLKAGKHLLCEKPMTTSYEDTLSLIQEARKQKVFLMEAIWTRCMPAYKKVLKLISSGEIGEVQYLQSNFSFFNDWGPERRLFNKTLAGGATYDVGIYNLSLTFDVLGEHPVEIKSIGDITPGGVDIACANLLLYNAGKMASLHCGFRLNTDHQARIFGSKGWIEMEPHWKIQQFTVYHPDAQPTEHNLPLLASGYAHEIIEVVDCIKQGKLESDLVSHSTSLNLAKTIDIILTQIGYK